MAYGFFGKLKNKFFNYFIDLERTLNEDWEAPSPNAKQLDIRPFDKREQAIVEDISGKMEKMMKRDGYVR